MWDSQHNGTGRFLKPGATASVRNELFARVARAAMFASEPFPGHQFRLDWRRSDGSGNWYYALGLELEGWLSPALLRYFPEAPKAIYFQVKSRQACPSSE